MKLRIQGNSLRLRLTQREVAQLRDRSRVESSIAFAPGRTFFYSIEGSFDVKAVTADFEGQVIHVTVPTQMMTEWAESERVSIEALSQAGVQLVIEKDFHCLHQAREKDPDAYPPLLS